MSHNLLLRRFLSSNRLLEGGSDAEVRKLRISLRPIDVSAIRRRIEGCPARWRRKTCGDIVLQERRLVKIFKYTQFSSSSLKPFTQPFKQSIRRLVMPIPGFTCARDCLWPIENKRIVRSSETISFHEKKKKTCETEPPKEGFIEYVPGNQINLLTFIGSVSFCSRSGPKDRWLMLLVLCSETPLIFIFIDFLCGTAVFFFFCKKSTPRER